MFKTSKGQEITKNDKIDTIVGASAIIEGIVKTTGTARIDGKVKGKAEADGLLIIGDTGEIEGNIFAESMLVAGKIHGNILVKERLEVTETGQIVGDIVTKSLVIAEGASFEGNSTMGLKKNSMVEQEDEKMKGNDEIDGKRDIDKDLNITTVSEAEEDITSTEKEEDGDEKKV